MKRSKSQMTGKQIGLARRDRQLGEGCVLEHLEQRSLLSFSWTPQEVYLAELVNRARANPSAEGARLGINLAAGLSSAEQARLVPQQPLALNPFLTTAARGHALDMANRNFFDHVNPDGKNPTQRATMAGYSGSVGENIAAGYTTIDAVHQAWLQSVEHRKNVLSLWSNFTDSFHYDEFGPAISFDVGGAYDDYFAQEFGVRSTDATNFLLGVVINDADQDNFYDIGEGVGGIRIDVVASSNPGVVVATYTTDAAGNYQILLAQGTYDVTFTDTNSGKVYTTSASIGTENVKVDALFSQLVAGTEPDDVVNAGDWANAQILALNVGGTAASSTLLNIGASGDTDLFRVTAGGSGVAKFTMISFSNGFDQKVRVFDSSGNLIGSTVGTGFGTGAEVTFNVIAGQTYFAVAEGATVNEAGGYLLAYEGPGYGVGAAGITDQHKLAANSTPVVTVNSSGNLLVGYISASGSPMFASRDSMGVWTTINLSTIQSATYTGTLVTWNDFITGDQMVAATSTSGVILFRNNGGSWSARNLSSELSADVITSEIFLLTRPTGRVLLTGYNATGDLWVFQQGNTSSMAGDPTFFATNLTDVQLPMTGSTIPALIGRLTGWITYKGIVNIVGVDATGQLRRVWKPNTSNWQHQNLTQIAGVSAPILPVLTNFRAIANNTLITATTAAGRSIAVQFRPGIGWFSNDLNTLTGAPADAQAGSTGSWVTQAGPGYAFTLTSAGEGRLLRYRYKFNTWENAGVAMTGTPVLFGYVGIGHHAATARTYIVGTNAGGEMVLLTQAANQTWAYENLSELLIV